MDFSKYDPLKKHKPDPDIALPAEDSPVDTRGDLHWMRSQRIARLIDHLGQNVALGISACIRDGRCHLVFSPGLTRDDIGSDRWSAAEQAEGLLRDAAADLIALVASGIEIPMIEKAPGARSLSTDVQAERVFDQESETTTRKDDGHGRRETQGAFGWG